MDMNTLYGILLAVTLGLVIMFFQRLNKKKSWKGTVTKIKRTERARQRESEDDNSLTDINYKIYYRTDTGKSSHFTITDYSFESLYPGIKEGSKLEKKSGSDYPDMVG